MLQTELTQHSALPAALPATSAAPTVPPRAVSRTVARRPGVATLRRAAALLLRRTLALAFGVVQVLLLLRIALLALAADPDNTLVRLTLQTSAGLEAPFSNIFRVNTIAAGAGSVIDVTALVAVLGWTLLQGLLLAVLSLGSPSRR